MSAVEEYRKERLRRGPDVDGLTADAAVAELEAENLKLKNQLREKFDLAASEPIARRIAELEAERDKWEWVARHADRPSLMDRPRLCERSDAAIAFILARWQPREGGEG